MNVFMYGEYAEKCQKCAVAVSCFLILKPSDLFSLGFVGSWELCCMILIIIEHSCFGVQILEDLLDLAKYWDSQI